MLLHHSARKMEGGYVGAPHCMRTYASYNRLHRLFFCPRSGVWGEDQVRTTEVICSSRANTYVHAHNTHSTQRWMYDVTMCKQGLSPCVHRASYTSLVFSSCCTYAVCTRTESALPFSIDVRCCWYPWQRPMAAVGRYSMNLT